MITMVPNRRQPKVTGVVAQGSEAEGRALFHAKEARHRDRRNNRYEATKHNDEPCCDVPRNSLGRRVCIVVQAIGNAQSIEGGTIVRRVRGELVDDLG